MSDHDKAKSLVLRFRHYATEFRSIRGYTRKDGDELALPKLVGNAISEAVFFKLMPGSMIDQFTTSYRKRMVYFDEVICQDAIGYRAAVRSFHNPQYDEQSGDDYEIEMFSVGLEPGWMAEVWPDVFPVIHAESFYDRQEAEEARVGAVHKYRFDVLGYHAQACDLLADWIEKHMSDQQINVEVDTAAIVKMLRHLDLEYLALRPSPNGGPCPGLVRAELRLRHEVGRVLLRSYKGGILPSPIAENIATGEADLCCGVIGYVNTIGINDTGEPGGDRLRLVPGSISLVWPEVFTPLHVGDIVQSGEKIKTVFDVQSITSIVFGYYAEACRMLADWIEKHHVRRDQEDNRDALGSKALAAVVNSGLAGVLRTAGKAPAKAQVTAAIRDMLAEDSRRYEWTANDWVRALKASKPTIVKSEGWQEIMRWREANRQKLVSQKTKQ
jgi:hypothetical protein